MAPAQRLHKDLHDEVADSEIDGGVLRVTQIASLERVGQLFLFQNMGAFTMKMEMKMETKPPL